MAKDTEEPDKKKAEQRTKEAKALQKELEQCKKELAGMVAQVKQLDQKVG